MNTSKKQVLAAYKRTSHSAEKVILTNAERRVLKLLGLRNINVEERRVIMKKCLNEAWTMHIKKPLKQSV